MEADSLTQSENTIPLEPDSKADNSKRSTKNTRALKRGPEIRRIITAMPEPELMWQRSLNEQFTDEVPAAKIKSSAKVSEKPAPAETKTVEAKVELPKEPEPANNEKDMSSGDTYNFTTYHENVLTPNPDWFAAKSEVHEAPKPQMAAQEQQPEPEPPTPPGQSQFNKQEQTSFPDFASFNYNPGESAEELVARHEILPPIYSEPSPEASKFDRANAPNIENAVNPNAPENVNSSRQPENLAAETAEKPERKRRRLGFGLRRKSPEASYYNQEPDANDEHLEIEQPQGSPELSMIAEKITLDGVNVREMFQTGLLSEAGMRRIVKEFLSGGDTARVIAEEIQSKELSYEHDPELRRTVRRSRLIPKIDLTRLKAVLPPKQARQYFYSFVRDHAEEYFEAAGEMVKSYPQIAGWVAVVILYLAIIIAIFW